jgi:hypothetical protein
MSDQSEILVNAAQFISEELSSLRSTFDYESYPIRQGIRAEIALLTYFKEKIQMMELGAELDLRKEVFDYMQDNEVNLLHVYEHAISRIKPYINQLEQLGVPVKTGVKWISSAYD